MPRRFLAPVAFTAAACLVTASSAQYSQAPSLVGTWSGTLQQPTASSQFNEVFYANGTFMEVARSVDHLGNVSFLELKGQYRVRQVGANQYVLDEHLLDYLPKTVCVVGFSCQPNHLNQNTSEQFAFTSASTIQRGASFEQRTNAPGLLAMANQVPAVRYLRAPAPPRPYNGGGGYTGGGGATGGGGGAPCSIGNRTQACDNVDVERTCYLSSGTIRTLPDGREVCVN